MPVSVPARCRRTPRREGKWGSESIPEVEGEGDVDLYGVSFKTGPHTSLPWERPVRRRGTEGPKGDRPSTPTALCVRGPLCRVVVLSPSDRAR